MPALRNFYFILPAAEPVAVFKAILCIFCRLNNARTKFRVKASNGCIVRNMTESFEFNENDVQ